MVIWILFLLLGAAFLFLAGDFFLRFTARNMTENPDFVMTCTKTYFLCVFAANAVCLFTTIWSVTSAGDPPVVIPVVLVLMSAWLTYELYWALFVRAEFRGNRCVHRSGRGMTTDFTGPEIEHVEYHQRVRWFVIKLNDGRLVRISRTMSRLPEFSAWILKQVDERHIEQDTQKVLVETEKGNPPSIWL